MFSGYFSWPLFCSFFSVQGMVSPEGHLAFLSLHFILSWSHSFTQTPVCAGDSQLYMSSSWSSLLWSCWAWPHIFPTHISDALQPKLNLPTQSKGQHVVLSSQTQEMASQILFSKSFYFLKIYVFYFICMSVSLACLCATHVCLVPREVRRVCWVQKWNNRWLWPYGHRELKLGPRQDQ